MGVVFIVLVLLSFVDMQRADSSDLYYSVVLTLTHNNISISNLLQPRHLHVSNLYQRLKTDGTVTRPLSPAGPQKATLTRPSSSSFAESHCVHGFNPS